MNSFDYMFLTIICALNLSILIVTIILINNIDDRTYSIKQMLKEQEAVKPVLDELTGRLWLCGKCGSYVGFEDNDPHDQNEFDKYCRECGSPILWKVGES